VQSDLRHNSEAHSTANSITLGIVRAGSAQSISQSIAGGKRPELRADIKTRVLERDNHTCKFCGFHAQKYQDVIAVKGAISNKGDAHPDQLATACIFCAQCFDLEHVSDMRSGVLVWLPEIDQAALHHMARAIYVARISQGAVANAARQSLDVLMQRREEVRNRLGTDDPYILSQVLKDYLTDRHYQMRNSKLDGVRLFPLDRRIIKEADLEFNQFPQILAYWRSKDGPFAGRLPAQWPALLGEIRAAA